MINYSAFKMHLSDTCDDTKPFSLQKIPAAGEDRDKYSTHVCNGGVWKQKYTTWKQKYTTFFILNTSNISNLDQLSSFTIWRTFLLCYSAWQHSYQVSLNTTRTKLRYVAIALSSERFVPKFLLTALLVLWVLVFRSWALLPNLLQGLLVALKPSLCS